MWTHPQLDKISQGWILSQPGPEGFIQAEFGETVARLLCLPSSRCQPKIGDPLGQKGLLINPFGDNVMAVGNRGQLQIQTIRHDKVRLS